MAYFQASSVLQKRSELPVSFWMRLVESSGLLVGIVGVLSRLGDVRSALYCVWDLLNRSSLPAAQARQRGRLLARVAPHRAASLRARLASQQDGVQLHLRQ